MADCASYVKGFKEDSDTYKLYNALIGSQVLDAELDAGYQTIDYTAPGQWGPIKGAGDCFQDKREVEEYAFDMWRLFKPAVTEWNRERLFWDFDEVTVQKKPFLGLARGVQKIIKEDLKKRGIAENSDEYRKTLSAGLFAVFSFPSSGLWKDLDKSTRGESLDMINRWTAEYHLSPAIKNYLIKNGGYGFQYSRYDAYPGNSYKENAFLFTYNTAGAPELYAIFEDAGLVPVFVEFSGFEEGRFTCSQFIDVSVGVAIPLFSGFAAFNIPNLKPFSHETFYPMSIGQVNASRGFNSVFKKMYLGRQPGNDSAEDAQTYDGFTATVVALSDISADIQEESAIEFIKHIIAHPESTSPMFYSVLIGSVLMSDLRPLFTDIKSHPALPKQGVGDYLDIAFNYNNSDEENSPKIIDAAERLLKVDPNCFTAHLAIAIKLLDEENMDNPERIESHLNESFNGLSERRFVI